MNSFTNIVHLNLSCNKQWQETNFLNHGFTWVKIVWTHTKVLVWNVFVITVLKTFYKYSYLCKCESNSLTVKPLLLLTFLR